MRSMLPFCKIVTPPNDADSWLALSNSSSSLVHIFFAVNRRFISTLFGVRIALDVFRISGVIPRR